jgi:AmmeMemoRadiSam system protein B
MMAGTAVRLPAVSGVFYEADPGRLRRQVEACFDHPVGPGRRPRPWGSRRVIGLVVPHAALAYSGPVAAHAYLRLAEGREPAVVVIVGPDHHGAGLAVAAAPHARWRTPLGDVTTDHPVKDALRRRGIALDARGHSREHSIEVQVPFLHVLGFHGSVVPVAMAEQDPDTVWDLAAALDTAAGDQEVVLIASTDLSHYLPHEQAVLADQPILDALASGDGRRLLDLAARRPGSMCGAGPAAAVLEAARRLGGRRVAVLRYATSGETGGDRDRVVGYAAAVLEAA